MIHVRLSAMSACPPCQANRRTGGVSLRAPMVSSVPPQTPTWPSLVSSVRWRERWVAHSSDGSSRMAPTRRMTAASLGNADDHQRPGGLCSDLERRRGQEPAEGCGA